jgi:hypothetical protein
MICYQCGAKLTSTANFCGGCGAKQISVNHTASQSFDLASNCVESKPSKVISSPRVFPKLYDQPTPNHDVRTMFVLGAALPMAHEKWLLSKYPSSKVIRYTTKGAVRSRVVQAVKLKQLDSLTIIGSNVSVPPCNLHDDNESNYYKEYQGIVKYRPVESDAYYAIEHLPINELPSQKTVYTSVSLAKRLAKLGPGAMMGEIPVGRIPFDDFSQCQKYLESIEVHSANSHKNWWGISEDLDDWVWECRAILEELEVTYSIDRVDGDDTQFHSLRSKLNCLPPGTRLLLNLHGSLPNKDPDSQQFTPGLAHNSHQKIDLSQIADATNSFLFLFACYGGNSKYWQSFGAIPHFLSVGGVAVIAASTSVWCTQESDLPNEIAPGAARIAYEFFAASAQGIPVGDALIIAKANTLLRALDMEEPWLICKTIKEIVQFSLYGAPWAPLESKSTSPPSSTPKVGSILDQVRSGMGVNSNLQKNIANGLLSQVRSRLYESLGDGADFFILSRQHTLERFVANPAFNVWKNQVEAEGFNLEEGLFESVIWGENVLNLVTLSSVNQDHDLVVILDDVGNLIRSLDAKGKKNEHK